MIEWLYRYNRHNGQDTWTTIWRGERYEIQVYILDSFPSPHRGQWRVRLARTTVVNYMSGTYRNALREDFGQHRGEALTTALHYRRDFLAILMEDAL